MAKVMFDLRATVSYYTLDGNPITSEAGYIQGVINQNPGVVYHEKEIFYTKRFTGKKVWDLVDEIERYRRTPEFVAEIAVAAQAHGIDRTNTKVYSIWVDVERVKA